MSIAVRVAQRFALTIMNAGTAAVALGSAYLAHKYALKLSFIDDHFLNLF